uniref:Zinc knuckle CX2CX4HX4C domain-containing protein n=1 Tax=Nelumbo nucifera TaxID=4432 RepID=A0A822Z1A6_NELNU|nr:TPA_asm: hypothetical protein HUJ06_009131 [Nelumbo nucifera]
MIPHEMVSNLDVYLILVSSIRLLHKGEPSLRPEDYFLNRADFWVHMVGLPLAYLNSNAVKKLASELGSPFEPDPKDVSKWSQYARIRISIVVTEPIKQEVPFELLNGKTILVDVQYERLPRYCMFCAKIGHEVESCRTKHRLLQAIEDSKSQDMKGKSKALLVDRITKEIRANTVQRSSSSKMNFNLNCDRARDSGQQNPVTSPPDPSPSAIQQGTRTDVNSDDCTIQKEGGIIPKN